MNKRTGYVVYLQTSLGTEIMTIYCAIWPVPQLRRLVAGFPPRRRPGFDPRSDHVGFVVDKVALGQVFSEFFGFSCQFSFHRLLHTHHLSSGAGTYQVDSVSPHPKKLLCHLKLLYTKLGNKIIM
jgi:hypothetical protein